MCHKSYKIGDRIKSFVIINMDRRTKHREILYECRCDCGNCKYIRASSIKSGEVRCMKCHIHKKLELSYLIGMKFNKWTVIGFSHPFIRKQYGRNYFYIQVQCDCGIVKDIPYHLVKSGNIRSCGCSRKDKEFDFDDLSGHTFGHYTVLRRIVNPKNKNQLYECQCRCGNIRQVLRYNLVSGDSSSCGCRSFCDSKLESLVVDMLTQLHFDFIRNKTFCGLTGDLGRNLSYDFMVGDVLIECQGEQHYYPIEFFGGNVAFQKQQEYDRRKRMYAITHNMKLIEIPYYYSNDEIYEVLLSLKREARSEDYSCNESGSDGL